MLVAKEGLPFSSAEQEIIALHIGVGTVWAPKLSLKIMPLRFSSSCDTPRPVQWEPFSSFKYIVVFAIKAHLKQENTKWLLEVWVFPTCCCHFKAVVWWAADTLESKPAPRPARVARPHLAMKKGSQMTSWSGSFRRMLGLLIVASSRPHSMSCGGVIRVPYT